MDLWDELEALHAEMLELVDKLRVTGCQYAENEARYRMELRKEILEERSNGTPVTVIGDICRGREDIARMKQSRDCSEALYKAAQEAINVDKLRTRVLEAQMDREYRG